MQPHLGRGGVDAQLMHLEAERAAFYLSLQVGLQSCEMLYAGQRCSMESNMSVLNRDIFDHESDRQSPTGGVFRCRRRIYG